MTASVPTLPLTPPDPAVPGGDLAGPPAVARPAAAGTRPEPPMPWVLLAVLVLIGAALLGCWHLRNPVADAAERPAGEFSAQRALTPLQRIAAEPHPTGSAANAKVRDYLVQQLEGLGLQTEVQHELGVLALGEASVGGYVDNVVGRLKGRAGGKAVMLAAHYDSVPTGPGAADDGASVAAILETLRALRQGAPLENDVIVLFTDGEEVGMLGSEAFVSRHPWAKDVALVLNFEYRGNSGPMLMFETGKGNGALIKALAAQPLATGNSLMHEIYKRMPNSTDMSAFKAGGLTGLNFAALERPTVYHNQLDSWDRVNLGTVQQQGELMLGLTRHFGAADLGQLKARDSVYFNLPAVGLVRYPAALTLPLAALLVLGFSAVVMVGARQAGLRWKRSVLGLFVQLFLAIGAAALLAAVWLGICAVHPQYAVLMDAYNASWYALAFASLALALALPSQGLLKRWFSLQEAAVGALGLWTLLAVLASMAMPGASYVFAWPLVPVLAAQAWQFSARGAAASPARQLAVWCVAAALVLLVLAPVVRLLFIAVTLHMSFAVSLVMMLGVALLLPLWVRLRHRLLWPALPLLAALVALGAGSMTADVSEAQPQPAALFYAQAPGSTQAYWLSTDEKLDAWQRKVLGAEPEHRKMPELFGDRPRVYWAAPAPALQLAAPVMALLGDRVQDGVRIVDVRVQTPRQAPQVKLYAEGVKVRQALVEGRAISKQPQSDWVAALQGVPADGVRLTLQVEPGRAFVLRAVDRTYGLPSQWVPPRDASHISQHMGTSDTLQAITALGLGAQP